MFPICFQNVSHFHIHYLFLCLQHSATTGTVTWGNVFDSSINLEREERMQDGQMDVHSKKLQLDASVIYLYLTSSFECTSFPLRRASKVKRQQSSLQTSPISMTGLTFWSIPLLIDSDKLSLDQSFPSPLHYPP